MICMRADRPLPWPLNGPRDMKVGKHWPVFCLDPQSQHLQGSEKRDLKKAVFNWNAYSDDHRDAPD